MNELPYSSEDRIKLTASDYVIGSFLPHPEESLLFFTQTGKVIHREAASLELSKSPLAKGLPLISPARLEQGVRFIGAASVGEADRIVVLDAKGQSQNPSSGSRDRLRLDRSRWSGPVHWRDPR